MDAKHLHDSPRELRWFLPFAEHPFAIFKSWTWLKVEGFGYSLRKRLKLEVPCLLRSTSQYALPSCIREFYSLSHAYTEMYVCTPIYIYIYICIYTHCREAEREREKSHNYIPPCIHPHLIPIKSPGYTQISDVGGCDFVSSEWAPVAMNQTIDSWSKDVNLVDAVP